MAADSTDRNLNQGRRELLRLTGVAGAAALLMPVSAWSAEVRPSRPNIVVILADDLGYAGLGCQGCRDIPTPHIDSLAANGVRFTDGHANHPVCSPSRAGLLSGRYQHRFGFEHNSGPERFAAENFGLLRNGQPVTDEKEYLTDACAREAVSFIERSASTGSAPARPFFLYLAFNAADTDGDGKLTADEVPFGDYLKQWAADGYGAVTLDEIRAVYVDRWQQRNGQAAAPAAIPITSCRDLAYARVEGVDPVLTSLDLCAPAAAKDCPVMLYVRGGGWARGDKGQVAGETCLATPAVSGNSVLLRTLTWLYRIENRAWSRARPGRFRERAEIAELVNDTTPGIISWPLPYVIPSNRPMSP